MKSILIFVSTSFLGLFSFCQESCDNSWFLIKIDDNIVRSSEISNEYIVFESRKSKRDSIPITYQVGRFCFKKNDYDFLLKNAKEKFILKFKYYQTSPYQKKYNYELSIKKSWLRQDYLIYDIYNIDKKINRKRFSKNKKDDYYIDIVSPNFSILALRKSRKYSRWLGQ
jgi:hypothetical protein